MGSSGLVYSGDRRLPITDCEEVTAVVPNWDQLVREQGPLVFKTAWRILGHADDAEDVVQDVFLQMHQWQQTRPVRSWTGLLRRMATCRALDRLRARKLNLPLSEAALVTPDNPPESAAIEQELQERLRQAVGELPQREAEVFCLRYFEDLSYQQIAEALQIQTGAVAAALHKARAKLEAQLLETVRGA
jgi:RNA polymerase sigma-70 factor (ECF subfamily)